MKEKYKQMMDTRLAGVLFLRDIVNACSPYDNQMENMKWIKQGSPSSYPASVTEVFDSAHEQIVLHVDAALCGSSSPR